MTSAQVLYVVQSANYVSMAASAAVVYDQVLTFSQEVDLIWRRRWSLTTVLYLVARYSGTISVILATAGTVFLNWGYNVDVAQFIIGVWAINIFATAMDAILLMRAYALSSRSKAVLIFLSLCFFFQTVVVMVITGMEINVPNTRKFVTFIGGPIGSVTQDIETDASVFLPSPVIVTAAQLAYDMIVFLFALSAFWKHALEARGLAGRWNVNPLAKLLIRDQIFYFFCYVVWQALDIPVDAPGIPPRYST
ncbi:hypothetical protein BV22DRAFT_453148 [Leucogyrophana mollusca]|uniref:Uncharacterized protein n=1 Tax=Leucogyrophana mollusca TaxID=85980 RepID=A0ACB8BK07_9AGAM|nr:hypothetical protein BV22DRAFT_453148 [Leucogyrophana mollusca]